MKHLFFICLNICFITSCTTDFHNYPNGKPIDVLGSDMISQLEQKYDTIHDFIYGYSIVHNNQYGIINYRGEEIVPCSFDTILNFGSEAKILQKNKTIQVFSYEKASIINMQFDEYKSFENDTTLITLKQKNKWLVLSPNGDIILKPEFDEIPNIKNNHIVFGIDKQYGVADSIGKILIEAKYDSIYLNPEDDIISYAEKERCIGIINPQYKLVTQCEFNCKYYESEALHIRDIIVRKSRNGYVKMDKYSSSGIGTQKSGLINCMTGEISIPFEYDELGDYSEDLIWACNNDKYGYININNKVVIPFSYSKAYNFSEGVAAVGKTFGTLHANMGIVPNIKIGFINKSGSIVIPHKFNYQLPNLDLEFNEGLCAIGIANDNIYGLNIGYINHSGDYVIKPIYYHAENFKNGVAVVENYNHKRGCINSNGDIIIEIKYSFIDHENNRIYADGDYYNLNGQQIK